MKTKLHEFVNSIGVIISIGISLYVAYAADFRRRENFVVQSHYADPTDTRTRLIDGCIGLREPKYFRGIQAGGANCGYEIATTQWPLTISNLSDQSLAIVGVNFLIYDVRSKASYREDLTFIGPQPGLKLPINMQPHSAVEVTLARFWPVNLSKEAFAECSKNETLEDLNLCLVGMRSVDPDKRDRLIETLQVEFVSSSGTKVVSVLPNPV